MQRFRRGIGKFKDRLGSAAEEETVQRGSAWALESESFEISSGLEEPVTIGNGDPFGPTDSGPRNYKRPDTLILDEIAKALAFDPLIESFDLEVECVEGNVRVVGNLPAQAAKQRLDVLLSSIFGVRTISIADVIVSKMVKPISMEVAPKQQQE